MKDRVKIALKRGTSGLLAVLLAVCLVGEPKAKAVVSETALLGSIFGSLLVSMGYSWAADNMDVPTFGESIYKLTQEFDEAMKDTGIQLIRDLNLAGVTANGAGKLQFGYAWVQAARSLAEWFSQKYFAEDNSTAQIVNESKKILKFVNCDYVCGDIIPEDARLEMVNGRYWGYGYRDKSTLKDYSFGAFSSSNGDYVFGVFASEGPFHMELSDDGTYYDVVGRTGMHWLGKNSVATLVGIDDQSQNLDIAKGDVHYPDVAEDGSQVYEVAYQGVTATDLEGIIQKAVDQILSGTAVIAGSVVQAGAVEDVENPEIDPYKVGLTSVFPFCIPFDVYNMVTMLVAEPEAPHAEWTFTLPWGSQEYSVGWDLAAFDGVARVCRDMQLVLFAVGLAVITYKVIKW